MRVQLLCENVGYDNIQFEVSENSLVLGRSQKADIRVVHPLVSRLHCEWRLINGEVAVRDLESTNHTLINGEPVRQAVLQSGDRILLGDVLYIVEILDRPSQESEEEQLASHEGSEDSTPRFGMENASSQPEDR